MVLRLLGEHSFHLSLFTLYWSLGNPFFIFQFSFSICIAPSANTLFTFQFVLLPLRTLFSIFNLYCSLCEHFFNFHFSIFLVPSANTLFTFQFSLFNLYCSLGEHPFHFSIFTFQFVLLPWQTLFSFFTFHFVLVHKPSLRPHIHFSNFCHFFSFY